MSAASEADILSRIIEPDKPALQVGISKIIFKWKFPEDDRERMQRAKAGKLSRREKAEAETYDRVGHIVSILRSKARLSLKGRNGSS